MLDPVSLFYFGCVALAVFTAIKSGDDGLQQTAAALFAGWGFSNPLFYLMADNFAGYVAICAGLDVVLFGYVASLYHRTGTPAAKIVAGLFVPMFGLHLSYLVSPANAVYFPVMNALFFAQLLAIGIASVRTWQRKGNRSTHNEPERGSTIEAVVMPWPKTNHSKRTTFSRPGSMSAPRRFSHD